MNKVQLQELMNQGRFTKEEVAKNTSLEEIAAIFDGGTNHLKNDSIASVVKAAFQEIYRDNEYDAVYEQMTFVISYFRCW